MRFFRVFKNQLRFFSTNTNYWHILWQSGQPYSKITNSNIFLGKIWLPNALGVSLSSQLFPDHGLPILVISNVGKFCLYKNFTLPPNTFQQISDLTNHIPWEPPWKYRILSQVFCDQFFIILNSSLVTLNFSFTEIPTSFYEKSDQLIEFCVLELV